MTNLAMHILGVAPAAILLSAAGPALAAGGSEDGARQCAVAAIDETGQRFTHVDRSVRRNHTIEEFWLSTRAGDGPVVYCRYNRRDKAVEIIDVEV